MILPELMQLRQLDDRPLQDYLFLMGDGTLQLGDQQPDIKMVLDCVPGESEREILTTKLDGTMCSKWIEVSKERFAKHAERMMMRW